MMVDALVSVIMPVYNAEAFVGQSIRSILEQYHTDLELIIVNDGSTDRSDEIIRAFTDPRIIYHRTTNHGVAHALNRALDSAKGIYVARQDADDVAYASRLERQVARFRADPSLVICGTWARIVRENGSPRDLHRHPTTDATIRYAALFDSPFVSSSVMFLRSALDKTGPFDTGDLVFDDYDMWSRLMRTGMAANIPELLMDYREVGSSLSRTSTDADARRLEQRRRNLRHGISGGATEETVELAAHIGIHGGTLTAQQLRAVKRLYLEHIARYAKTGPELRSMRHDLHERLLGYRLIGGPSSTQRILDRAWKEFVLRSTLGE